MTNRNRYDKFPALTCSQANKSRRSDTIVLYWSLVSSCWKALSANQNLYEALAFGVVGYVRYDEHNDVMAIVVGCMPTHRRAAIMATREKLA